MAHAFDNTRQGFQNKRMLLSQKAMGHGNIANNMAVCLP